MTMQEDLLSTNVESLRQICRKALEEAPSANSLIIDLTGTGAVDSKGLNLLIGLYQESNRRTWSFKVQGASAEIRQLFSFVKLTERFGISP